MTSRRSALILLLIVATVSLRAECPARRGDIPNLVEQQRWHEAAECLEGLSGRSPDEQYDYGRSLAAVGRGADAETTFEAGERSAPGDARFPTELAGLAFRDERYADAKKHLKRALRLAPGDPYLIDFLATVYLLEENLDAALLYWNRIDKPRIERVDLAVSPGADTVLLDRAFALAPASTLRLADLELTRARLRRLGFYSQQRFNLLAREEQDFDLQFQALEKPGWRGSKRYVALSLLSGLPYQTVHPEVFNVDGRGLNVRSLVRWNPKLRRLNVSITKPVGRDPSRGLAFFLDGRDEQWRLPQAAANTGSEGIAGFGMRKAEAGLEYSVVPNGRFTWRTGVTVTTRQFRDQAPVAAGQPAQNSDLFHEGLSVNSLFGIDLTVLRLAARRVTLDASADWRLGRMLRDATGPYSRWTQSLTLRWFPEATGDDYAVLTRWSSGQTFGRAPLDEFYALGMERDNDLWLRGHSGTADGYKGAALLGDRYQLLNAELDKIVYRHPLLKLTAGPFLDAGAIRDSRGVFSAAGWQWDSGLQCKASLAGGLSVVFSYGRNLQSGSDAFYWRIVR